ncbi:hypothetical protein ABPG72_008112 [Tetrahymena utriculariae]
MSLEQFKNKYKLFSNHDNLSLALSSIRPSGCTYLRDSVKKGIQLIMGMNSDLIENYGVKDRHFLHIIITDGQDTGSNTSKQELAKIMIILGVAIPNQMIQNHFIGIDFDPDSQDAQELAALSILGRDTSDFHIAQTANVGEIFSRIQAQVRVSQQTRVQAVQTNNIALMRVQQEEHRVLELQVKKFIVVFNLDISGSMAGSRWRQVCDCVSKFTDSLTEHDFASVILFNDQIQIVQPITLRIEFQVSSRPSQQQPSNQNSNNNYQNNLTQQNNNQQRANTYQQNITRSSNYANPNTSHYEYQDDLPLIGKPKKNNNRDNVQENVCCCTIF